MEGPDWRGFALDNLQNKSTAEKASWILGLIWAIWHFPLFISLYHNQEIITIIFSLAGFTMVMIGQTIIYTWFYNNTKSVFITILHHAGGLPASMVVDTGQKLSWVKKSVPVNPEFCIQLSVRLHQERLVALSKKYIL